MAADPRNLLRYLRECYRENGGRRALWNVFADSVSHRLFLHETDFLAECQEAEEAHYLRESAAARISRQAQLFRKDKDLVYASIFVVGRVEAAGRLPETLCAPLFLFPATLDTEGLAQGASLRIDPSRRQINIPVVEAIVGEEFALRLEAKLEQFPTSESCVSELRRLFAEVSPEAATDPLLQYPRLLDGPSLKDRWEKTKSDSTRAFALVPAACVALVNKSPEMRGVLNELDAMGEEGHRLSNPVRALLGQLTVSLPPLPAGHSPVTLNPSQELLLESARSNALTLAIGPPGTGKSFTIAALAIETLSRGGSILIASKMDHAVDVVGRKIDETLGLAGVVTRGGRSDYLKELRSFVDSLLAGIHTAEAPNGATLSALRKDFRNKESRVPRLFRNLSKNLAREQKWRRLMADPAPGFFRRLALKRLRKRLSRGEDKAPAWQILADLQRLIDARHQALISYLKAQRSHGLAKLLKSDRQVLKDFAKALRSRTSERQDSYFQRIGTKRLLRALPVWLVNLSDIYRVLPQECEIFDLAVVDEATQCDIAAALPIFQRARRAVIVGDPKQLRHISFLPLARQAALATQFGLDENQRGAWSFRDVSLLDLAADRIADQSQVVFLNEHFRGRPEIIAFSNREFYDGNLRIMTSHRPAFGPALQFHWLHKGRRDDGGVNRPEADAVLAAIDEVLAKSDARPADHAPSIGVLSPFRDQVDHLQRLILRHPRAGTLLSRHDLLIGTAHSFQGEERDLMFLSLALDETSPAASFRFLEKPDLFNVAITRARLSNRVWHSFPAARAGADSSLFRYLSQAISEVAEKPARNIARDAFAEEVAAALTEAEAVVRRHFSPSGIEIDIVYTFEGLTRGIALVGSPSAPAAALPFERLLAFRRAGLPMTLLPHSAWLFQRERCMDWLLRRQPGGW